MNGLLTELMEDLFTRHKTFHVPSYSLPDERPEEGSVMIYFI